jgi:hypothetical protein
VRDHHELTSNLSYVKMTGWESIVSKRAYSGSRAPGSATIRSIPAAVMSSTMKSKDQRTLTISDTRIGMSREEVMANIGTIAKSGTCELREKLKEGQSSQVPAEFIGAECGLRLYARRVMIMEPRSQHHTNAAFQELLQSVAEARFIVKQDAIARCRAD